MNNPFKPASLSDSPDCVPSENPISNPIKPGVFQAVYALHAGLLEVVSNVSDPIAILDSQLRLYRAESSSASSAHRVLVSFRFLDAADPTDGKRWKAISESFQGLLRRSDAKSVEPNPEGLWHVRNGTADHLYKPDTLYAGISRGDTTHVVLSVLGNRSRLAGTQTPFRIKGEPGGSIHEFEWDWVIDLVKALYAQAYDLHAMHTAMVSRGSETVLVGGDSGAGKTTTALTLVREGFRLHTDDYCLTRLEDGGGVRCGGILMPPRLVGHPPSDISDLETSLSVSREYGKYPFDSVLSSHAAVKAAWRIPRLVLLLNRTDARPSQHQVVRLHGAEALTGVLDLALDPLRMTRCESWMNVALELIGTCPVYRITAGRDLRSLARLVGDLLSNE